MSLYKEWSTDNDSLAAIWKIEEDEAFFTERVKHSSDISNDKRRLEYLAGRFLLKHLENDFPVLTITPDKHDKPRVNNNEYFFSISHSWPYVAVTVSKEHEAGIDIQTWHPGIERIQHKFLSEDEQTIFKNDPQLITLAWSAKEAAYKWQGKRGVEFIEHLPIMFFEKKMNYFYFNIYLSLPTPPQMINIESIIEPSFACSYITHTQDWAIY